MFIFKSRAAKSFCVRKNSEKENEKYTHSSSKQQSENEPTSNQIE